MSTYAALSELPSSEKAILAHMEPSQRLVLWTLDSGAIYKRSVDYYTIDVKVDDTSLTEAASSSLSAGEWFFDYSAKELYVRMSDDSNPQASFVSATYRLFFSNAPYILDHDLSGTGNAVEYEGLINTASSFPHEVDPETQIGIALESNGSLSFIGTSGFWKDKFDRLFWENKNVTIYSWFPDLPISQNQRIFSGELENKTYSTRRVSFRVKDFVHKLRLPVALELFSDSDGDLNDDVIGTPKRRLYGKFEGIQMQSIDQVGNGFDLTGTIAGTIGGTTITGTGTSFLSEVSPGDEIFYVLNDETFSFRVDSIASDTSLTTGDELEDTITGLSATNLPEIPYRGKNREFLVAGHKLREPSTTVTAVEQLNRFTVADGSDMFAGDRIKIGSINRFIKRIDGNDIILTQNLPAFPSISDAVVRNPITRIFFNKRELVIDRDFTVTNTTECKINFLDTAEFNQTKRVSMLGTITFTNASRSVTGSGTKFTDDLRPRDWIISDDVGHQIFYEILEVTDDTNLVLRVAYAGANNTGSAKRKNVTYIDDDSMVTVDCYGKENASGEWVKTASDTVKDLVTEAGISNIDTAEFSLSDDKAPYIMSLALPIEPRGQVPLTREAIDLVNQSVFGSLVNKTNGDVAFNVLDVDRDSTIKELKDDDIISWKISTRTDIRRKVVGFYRHFDADSITGNQGSKFVDFENSFVDNLIGSKDELEVNIYLFETNAAQNITERYGLFHSLSQSIVEVEAKLNLTLKNINEKLLINLDNLFDRFGLDSVQQKIGIISKIERSFNGTSVRFSDLGNIFNRVPAIAPDTATDFTSATTQDKMIQGFIVDDDLELVSSTPTSDDEWGTQIIG